MRLTRVSVCALVAALVFSGVCSASAVDSQGLRSDVARAAAKASKGVQVSVLMRDIATGQDLVSIEAGRSMLPASNMKLITSAAALDLLGPEFNFETHLVKRGNDLVLIGDGDPGLFDSKLMEEYGLLRADVEKMWCDAAVRGGNKYDTLWIDDRVFDQQRVHPSWPVSQKDAWYQAEVSGLNFNDNCYDLWAVLSGGQVKLQMFPIGGFVSVNSQLRVAGSKERESFIVSRRSGSNKISVTGKVRNSSSQPQNCTMHDPAMVLGQWLQGKMKKAGVGVEKVVRIDSAAPSGVQQGDQLLHTVRMPLDPVLRRCNRDSQNLFAECLYKRIGAQTGGKPGTFAKGEAAIRAWLSQSLGESAVKVYAQADGSGLSRDNRVSATLLVSLLSHTMKDAKKAPLFLASLAKGGEGTLRRRFNPDTMTGKVYAKTGHIRGVSALSGVWVRELPQGGRQMVAFSILCNQSQGKYASPSAMKDIQDGMIKALDRRLGSQ